MQKFLQLGTNGLRIIEPVPLSSIFIFKLASSPPE